MRGRKSSSGRPGLNKGFEGRAAPTARAIDQGVVPAKQQLGFEVPGPSSATRETDNADPARLLFATSASIGSHAELLVRKSPDCSMERTSTRKLALSSACLSEYHVPFDFFQGRKFAFDKFSRYLHHATLHITRHSRPLLFHFGCPIVPYTRKSLHCMQRLALYGGHSSSAHHHPSICILVSSTRLSIIL